MSESNENINLLGMEPYEFYHKEHMKQNYPSAHLYKYVLIKMKSKDLISLDDSDIDTLSNSIQEKIVSIPRNTANINDPNFYGYYSPRIDSNLIEDILYFKENPEVLKSFIKSFEEVIKGMSEKDNLIKTSMEKIEDLTIEDLSDYLYNKLDEFIILLIAITYIYPNKDCINKIKQILKTLINVYNCWDNKEFLKRQFSKINGPCKHEDIEKIIDKLYDIRQKLQTDLVYPKSEISTTAIQDKIPYADYEYKDDNDSDNEYNDDNNFNQIWKANRKTIKNIIGVKGTSNNLINYGKNLILFYNNKINAVKKLLESKGMDSAKNFIGDVSIQNEQREKIKDIKDDKLIAETDPQQLQNIFKNYYGKIGNQANEIMNKDYENRHKTIMYNLLIKEYELNIKQITDTLNKNGANIVESNDNSNVDPNMIKLFEQFNQSGGSNIKIQSGDNLYDIIESRKDSNIDDYFSVIMDQYNFVQNNLITNPLVISLLLEFMLKIQNAQIDPSIIKEGNFNLNELTHIFSESLGPVKIKQTISVGGAEQIIRLNKVDQNLNITVNKGESFKVITETDEPDATWGYNGLTRSTNNIERTHYVISEDGSDNSTFLVKGPDTLRWNLNKKFNNIGTSTINVMVKEPVIIDVNLEYEDGQKLSKQFTLESNKTIKDLRTLIIEGKNGPWTDGKMPSYKVDSRENFEHYQFMNDSGQLLSENNKIETISNNTVKFVKKGTVMNVGDDSKCHSKLTKEMLMKMNQKQVAECATARAGVEPAALCVEALIEVGSFVGVAFQKWTPENIKQDLEDVKYFVDNGDNKKAVIDALLRMKAEANSGTCHSKLTKEMLIAMSQQEVAECATARARVEPADPCVEAVKEAILNGSAVFNWSEKIINGEIRDVQYFKDHLENKIKVMDALLGMKAEALNLKDIASDEHIQKMKEQLIRSKEQADVAQKEIAENIIEIKDDIDKNNEEIDRIKENVKKQEEQEIQIQNAYDELISGIKQKMESLMDFFGKQTKEMNDATSKLIKNMQELDQVILNEDKIIKSNTLKINNLQLDLMLEEIRNKKCDAKAIEIDKQILEDDSVMNYERGNRKIRNKEKFYIEEIQPNFLKNNLFEFIHACDKLDSIPAWRAEISKLIVNYLMKYVADPNSINPEKPTYIANIPSYNIFNLVIMGTPGVGKSFTADIVGKVLKHSGLLTKGDRHDIKKPDIVGSYTGQTAPKVYKELTECLGKVIFIDEAYSIAGPKDEDKGTYNEFGQESLDAITDYTSEHIGLSAFVAAGYEYEMKSQFLDVNIGLPRRFPTQLILTRYGLNTFWKILESYIIKFVKKIQVDNHHRACFELLNLLFNFQCGENPIIQLSNKWASCWKSNNIRNINVNLDIEINNDLKIKIPFLELLDFHNKVKDGEKPITSETVEEHMSKKYLKKSSLITKTFIKSYVLHNFCGIFNGDIFRSQADNLNKFSEYILDDKISNGEYDENKDTNYKFGHIEWIEHCYFNLYFTKNPNMNIHNIEYKFDNVVMVHSAGYKKINKKSRNNKKINKKSRNNRIENTTSKLIKKINNKKEGGKPGTPKGNEDLIDQTGKHDQDAHIDLDVPSAFFLNPRLESNIEPDLDVIEDIEYKQNLLNNFEADSIYEEGLVFYKKQDYDNAYDFFNKAIKTSKTHADSLFMLGEMMANGHGTSVNKNNALENYIQAAKYGNDEARFIIGHIYYYYSYDDTPKMWESFQKYGIKLSSDDNLNIAEFPDRDHAENIFVKYFTKLIDSCTLDFKSKIEPVVLLLAEHYFEKKDTNNAIKYLESAAFNHNSYEAYMKLAIYYLVIENNKKNGLIYLNSAASYGDYNIKIILAKFYNKEIDIENEDYKWLQELKDAQDIDLKKSMEYYKMAIQEMKTKGIDTNDIETIEVDYLTVKNEYEKDIYTKLIESTNKEEQFNIGKNFYYGENDYTRNTSYGLNLIYKSAENNYSKACYYKAKILYDLTNPCDIIDAEALTDINTNLTKACNSNLIEAIKFYANKLYTYQHILDIDKVKAAELYKKGAELGDSECQFIYASILINDKEVLQNVTDNDYSKAILYLHNASQNEELKSEANKLLLDLENEGIGMKDLIFNIMINFSDIFQVKDILIDISQSLKKDDTKSSNEINEIFNNFNEDNEIY